ncbi:DUF7319 domain-containing protein [Halorussus halobius]|uniref:DUF7319 domain-containing protein n=1 Tax=Halorussus halobius TaxID=1710537 RepID=UPI001B2FF908|nr:hypothetical protein [Halorussus halobius]
MTDASDDRTGESPGGSADDSGAMDDSDREDEPVATNARTPAADRDAGGEAPDAGGEDRDRPTPEEVEERYDFEDFGPGDMAEMSYEEWEAAFDHDAWITGDRLLDRVEADLANRVADRDVFAVLERVERDGEGRLLAYSDEGYAVVSPDGTVEGSGTVLRDVKPSVALASMESYEVPDPPEGDVLPDPAEVPEGSGELGNRLLQVIGAVHVLAGVVLLLSWFLFDISGQTVVIAIVAGLGFLLFGGFVFLLVANARLSDRFRSEEYRNRLRAVGLDGDERPEFLPSEGEPGAESSGDDVTAEDGVGTSGEGSVDEGVPSPRDRNE